MADATSNAPSITETATSADITARQRRLRIRGDTTAQNRGISLQFRSLSEPVASVQPGNENPARAINQLLSLNKAAEFCKLLAGGELQTHLHGSCPRCHHWHNHVEFQFRPGIHNKIRCQNEDCNHVIFGLGGNGSHESLMSQMTLPDANHHEQQSSPCFNGCSSHMLATLTISPRNTGGLRPVQEAETDHSLIDETSQPASSANVAGKTTEQRQSSDLKPHNPSVRLEQSYVSPHEEDTRLPASLEKTHKTGFSSFKSRFKKWKSQLPFELRWPVTLNYHENSPPANASLIGEGPKRLEAAYKAKISQEISPLPQQGTGYRFEENVEYLQPEGQRPRPSNGTTLNGTPNESRPRSTAGKGESTRDQAQQEASENDNKGKRRENIRQAMSIEAKEKLCKCTTECHCLQRPSNDKSPPSSMQQQISELDNQSAESRAELFPFLTGHTIPALEWSYQRSSLDFHGMGLGTLRNPPEPRDSLCESNDSRRGERFVNEFSNSRYSSPSPLGRTLQENSNGDLGQPDENTNSNAEHEPPALSDTSTTIVSSQRSETPSELYPGRIYGDAAVGFGFQTPPETYADVDGDRTPTREDFNCS